MAAVTFEWTPEMSVGEPTIDAQHQKLLAQLNTIIGTMVFGAGSKEVIEAVNFLDQYITEHLAYEEAYMERRGYKEIEEHKAKHQDFRTRYAAYKEKLESGNTPDSVLLDIEQFLGAWWVGHIAHEDHRYFEELGPAI